MSAESLVKHYWDCARVLEPEGHTRKLLKSYFMTKCRKLAKSTIWMPKEKFSTHTMCPRCSSKWNETNYKMFLKPQQIAYSTKARKQIEKLQEAKTSIENRRALTRKQRKRAKWLQKRVLNSVVIQCELCAHKTKIEMQKPNKTESNNETTDTTELEDIVPTETVAPTPVNLKKKKKKNKDKTAGLKLDKSKNLATKNNEVQNKTSVNKQVVPAATIKLQPSNKVVAKVNPTNKVAAKPTKPTAILSQPLKAKKQKQQKAKPANNTTPKVQSKTQQQNSLLQLAALLKSQTAAKTGANATQKRLESLLK
ncbi:uncharacterized protein LOC105218685 [Zeugodacus cucurbitae]|uniref:uncharacterized protein LOC105218685 n=1 Tax=Zeugodacus cucurbitae TaxID=28588 RepID=UPI0023D96E26|nr:uncharacterized protein LOC105218685 [Zeugodacus cucurbitae]